MSLMKSKQPPRWKKGDLITAKEACDLLGYKASNQLRIPERRQRLIDEFKELGCTLTVMQIGCQ